MATPHESNGIPAPSGEGHGGPFPPQKHADRCAPRPRIRFVGVCVCFDEESHRFVRRVTNAPPNPRWDKRRKRWDSHQQRFQFAEVAS
jgi:hypothetical protein